jgi:hypothetical protein
MLRPMGNLPKQKGPVAGLAALILALFSLAGCETVGVRGTRTQLARLPVTTVSASLYPQSTLSPGESGQLIIVASASDGRQWTTVGPGHGTVLFDNFVLNATVAQVSAKGVVSIPSDPRLSEGKEALCRVTVVGHPDVTTELQVPLRYDIAFTADFSGKPGLDGIDGADGLPGVDGASGPNDPTSPSRGGRGSDGSNGSDGGNGGNGQPGESVHVWITLEPGTRGFLQVRTASATREQLFLIDPNGGSLSVDTQGGPGGRAGRGGKGGRGGSGGGGFPRGSAGNYGMNGHDGIAGSDGAPGEIVVSIDPAARQYLDRFHLCHRCDNGTPGSPLVVRTEPVPPIW